MRLNNLLKLGLSSTGLFVSIFGVIFLQKISLNQLETVQNKEFYLREQEQFTSIAKIQKQLPSFGFNNLLANWSFLQFIQYFGDGEARQVTGYSTVTHYFEDIVNRDPNFIQSHFVMSSANSLFSAQPEKTVELLNQALKTVDSKVPNYPFLLWTYKATDEILFLGDIGAAQNSYVTAAEWASQWAIQEKDIVGHEMAERFNKTANFLASNPDPTQAQVGAWMNTLTTAKDRKTQDFVIDKLKELGAEVIISPEGRIQVNLPKKA